MVVDLEVLKERARILSCALAIVLKTVKLHLDVLCSCSSFDLLEMLGVADQGLFE